MIQLSALKEQPKQLRILFFAEMWERFSYYGMRALLVLYMTKYFGFSDEKAYGIYGAYGALIFGSPILGGYLADRFLGFRYSVIFGGVLMMVGHAIMSVSQPDYFFPALALIALGNGFFKPNISSLVGELYPEGDSRRDNGFIIFYMGINLGAFGQGLFGLLGEGVGWHWGFGMATVGMLLGLIVFYLGQNSLGDKGKPPRLEWLQEPGFLGIKRLQLILMGAVLLIPLYSYLLVYNSVLKYLLMVMGCSSVGYILYQAFLLDKVGRQKLLSALILIIFSVIFWSLFEQNGSSLSLFTDRNVNREFLGFIIPASAFQSVNAFFIITLAPFFAFLWSYLSKSNREPSITVKFILALLQVGFGFIIL
ncbi:MAG: peptide MFS transporter, partial [Cytophagales bacterium]|nr:peptide MFS transporter [Cytophagales bacterium]